MVGGIELVHAGVPFVYAGGAVDYHQRRKTHLWRHRLETPGMDVYCPICANSDSPTLDMLMQRNEIALYCATKAVFLLDGDFTIGTPVEVHMRVTHKQPSTVCIVHPQPEYGAFVQTWEKRGVRVVATIEEAVEWLAK